MSYLIVSKTNPNAYLTRLVAGPDAGKYGFATPQADFGQPVTYSTWAGACKAAVLYNGHVVTEGAATPGMFALS
jgi:hypothetical protein